MQQKIQETRGMLEQMQAAYEQPEEATTQKQEAPARSQEPLRERPQVIAVEEDSQYLESEDEEEGEYRRRRHYHGRHHEGPKSPLSAGLNEVLWPRRFSMQLFCRNLMEILTRRLMC